MTEESQCCCIKGKTLCHMFEWFLKLQPEEVLRDQRKSSETRGRPHRAEEVLTEQRKSSQTRGSPHRAEEVLTEQRKSSQSRGSPHRTEEVLRDQRKSNISVVFTSVLCSLRMSL
uniref:Uncharacterized protein n=1 Tax=Knipowitschia caucasica TaxID=637954 RepID=A0AAV2L035_KNICA